MDTVILAAGKGERLQGIAAPYTKPLLVVNGESLIRRAVRQAHEAAGGNVIVVVAPENALLISQVLHDLQALMVVQRQPLGPGSALYMGLLMSTTEKTLVLMSDNYTKTKDISRVVGDSYNAEIIVGTKPMKAGEAAERFTYLTPGGEWIEKEISYDLDPNREVDAWVGPIVIPTKAARRTLLEDWGYEPPIPIGWIFNQFTYSCTPVDSVDIGVPEALT